MVHGLAASIRAAKENEVFDLGGLNAGTITSVVQAAFAEPLADLPTDTEMIRITLITGAGKKQSRQKYDAAAHHAVVSALQQAGYTEDRTASGVAECAGSYKMQHDTAKNLKTIVIYPFVGAAAGGGGGGASSRETKAGENDEGEEEAIIPEDTPAYKLAAVSMITFQKIVESKCTSWSQKKGCLECLEALQNIIQSLDEKLVKGQPLTRSEQAFYSVVSQLEEKKQHVKHESKQQVEQGQITELEKNILLEHNAERLKEDPKNDKLKERKKLLQSIEPIPPPPLKYHVEIAKLQKELARLLHLNENQLLSIKERQMVTRRDQIWQEIIEYEEASRGWFEDNEMFAVRVAESRAGLERFTSSSKSGGGGGKLSTNGSAAAANAKISASKKSSGNTKWILPTDQKGGKKKKGGRTTGSDVFNAMRIKQGGGNSESSSEEDGEGDDEDDDSVQLPKEHVSAQPDKGKGKEESVDASATTKKAGNVNTSKSKKSKKKKKKSSAKQDESDDALLEAASRQATLARKEKEEDMKDDSAFGRVWRFLTVYIFPLILGLVMWLVGLLFGKPQKKTKKN